MNASLWRTIANELREDPATLTSARTMSSIAGWDSLVALSVMVLIGDETGVKVLPHEMFALKTFGDLERLVDDLVGRAPSTPDPWRNLVRDWIDRANASERVAAAAHLVVTSGALDVPSALFIADELEARIERDADLAALSPYPVVRSQLHGMRGELARAIAAATEAIDQAAHLDPWLFGMRARWEQRSGKTELAARDLRAALAAGPNAAWLARHERILVDVCDSEAWSERRACRIALLSTGTTATLVPALRATLFRDGIRAAIYEAPFGTLRQEVLDETSGLHAFKPDVVLLIANHHDLALPATRSEPAAIAFADEMIALWRVAAARLHCHVIQTLIDSPADGSWGQLEDARTGRRSAIAACNARLAAHVAAGVSLIAPTDRWTERAEWDAAKQYPARAMGLDFSNAVASHVRAALGLSSKVLLVDLDNTLWGGVVGEDGVGGLLLGPPSAEGEGYVALQRYIKELKERGVLLAAVSKNNLADARAPFADHDAMVLDFDDFVAFHASWTDKASAIRAIASELSLGLDAMVFLDDNPLERSWVRRELPEVVVPEVTGDPWAMRQALVAGRYFESLAITAEDLERSASYRATAAIHGATETSGGLDGFLSGLGMVVEHGPFDEIVLARVTQLVNKTNQFNVTTRRFTAEQLRALAASPEAWCRWFKLSDRFGDHGLVGVMIANRAAEAWTIDTWLMSCRVLGRRMEHLMCATVLEAAAAAGAKHVYGDYIATAKNELVRELYTQVGFEPHTEAGTARTYRFALDGRPLLAAPWIRVVAR